MATKQFCSKCCKKFEADTWIYMMREKESYGNTVCTCSVNYIITYYGRQFLTFNSALCYRVHVEHATKKKTRQSKLVHTSHVFISYSCKQQKNKSVTLSVNKV